MGGDTAPLKEHPLKSSTVKERAPISTGAAPERNWTRWETAGVLLALVIAHAYYFAWRDLPVLHDAAGYLRGAQDIVKNGLFSNYDLSDLRTYAWPLILSGLVRLSKGLGIPLRFLAFEFELGLHVAACLALRYAFRMTSLSSRLGTLVFLSVLLNPLVLIYPGYLLTESCSLSATILLLALCVCLVSSFGKRHFTAAAPGGCFLLSLAIMIRPGNVSLVPVWAVALVSGVALHRPRPSRFAATSALALLCGAAPLVPQVINNAKFHNARTPLVANDFAYGARGLGVRCIKYATSHIPDVDAQVFYENPLCQVAPPPELVTAWYLRHPVRGAATLGLHVFDLLDQDFPFPYNPTLLPAYYPAVSTMNLLVVGFGILGLIFALGPVMRNRRDLLPLYAMTVVMLICEIGIHIPYAVECRWGVPSLLVIYVFAAWFLVFQFRRLPVMAGLLMIASTGAFAAGGSVLSHWVRDQAPSIRAAEQAKKDHLQVPAILSSMRTAGQFVSGELRSWNLINAGVGPEGQAMLVTFAPGQISAAIQPVILIKNTDYAVGFDARARAGMTAELSVDLYAGASYDQLQQNSFFNGIGKTWVHYSARWNSGSNAPHDAMLRFVTVSQNPIEIRAVTFGRITR